MQLNKIREFMPLKRWVFLFIFLLYLIPTFVQFEYSESKTINNFYIGFPIMQTGDEPHYYIVLYSLVNDHDIYLTNNYDNAIYTEGPDAGTIKLNPYERHSRFFDSINRTVTAIPLVGDHRDITYTTTATSFIKEIPGHPIGLPFFSFLFLFLFRNTSFLEHLAIYLTLAISLFTIWIFYKLMIFYHKKEYKALLFTLVFAIATQYWYYSKTYWVEPYLTSFLIIAWYLISTQYSSGAYFLSGGLLGYGVFMKYPFVLTIIPFYVYEGYTYLYSKKITLNQIISFSLPLIIAGISLLCWNYYFTENPFQFDKADSLQLILPFKPIVLWLFSPSHGLLIFSPVLLFAFLGIKNFWKSYKIHCITVGLILIFYFLFWSAVNPDTAYSGAGAYSGRYLIPLIPCLVVFSSFYCLNKSTSFIFYGLFFISFAINLLAAFAYPAFVNTTLITALSKIIHFLITVIL